MPPNRAFPVQPHLPLWEGPSWVYCCSSSRFLPRGKVICGRYLGRVRRHKPCVPVVFVRILVPDWDRFCLPRRWPLVPLVGPEGCWSEWPRECHGSRSVLSERRVRTYWSARPWVPWCGYSVLTSAECVFNLSIAASSVVGTS